LYRLTGASYTGSLTNTFAYANDAVGNRTVQTQTITSTLVTNYGYDIANRLTNVNGVTYSWDDNGNLLSDGAKSYGYDQANRLKQVVQGAITTTLAYNGVGDRLSQTANGTTTRYVLDPGAGLTQVLADGTSTYLYGNDRLAQYQTAMQYYGVDGLGSVRQTYDASAQVVGSTRYDPNGNVMSQSGTATSVFAFAGEQYDSYIKLLYLRARWYDYGTGRFTQPDTIISDYANPQSLDRYAYVLNNPILYIDPSGRTRDDYYVIVRGCVPNLLVPVPCENTGEHDWEHYMNALRDRFGFSDQDPRGKQEWETWRNEHVKFIKAPTADPGGIAETLNAINPPKSTGQIELIGHSSGGSAILNYLLWLKESQRAKPAHLTSAIALQPPIESESTSVYSAVAYATALALGFNRYQWSVGLESLETCPPIPLPNVKKVDRLAGLGTWARHNGIRLIVASYEDDVFNYRDSSAVDKVGTIAGDIDFIERSTDKEYSSDLWDVQKKHGYFLSYYGDLAATKGTNWLINELFRANYLQ
jgi:RHS repeat-associated protein